MKTTHLLLVGLALCAVPAYSQTGALTLNNPSFEADAVTAFPGYRSEITGWEKVGPSGFGTNTDAGPFHDNGAIPDGTKVLFLQEASGVRQVVPGFTAGTTYTLQLRANARQVTTTPLLRISVGDVEILPPTPIPAVGGTNPYHVIRKAFVSSVSGGSTVTVESIKGAVDNTLLIDNIEIFPAPPETFRAATQLTPIFKKDAGSASSPTWFLADANTRGMCYNPHTGNLLVVDRDSNSVGNVYILDSATGNQLGSFNTQGMSGGIFVINKVAVDGAGRIFVSNLARTGETFRAYMYASEAAAQTTPPAIAFDLPGSPVRWGDDLDVTGSGASTTLLVASRLTENALLVLTDTDNNGTFTDANYTATAGGIAGPGNVAFDPASTDFYYHRSSHNLPMPHIDFPVLPLKLNGDSAGGPFLPNILAYATGPFDVAQTSQGKLLAVGPAEATVPLAGVLGFVYDMTQPNGPLFETGRLDPAGGYGSNGNGSGDVAIDSAGNRIFFLVTQNSISGWNLPAGPTGVKDWNLLQ